LSLTDEYCERSLYFEAAVREAAVARRGHSKRDSVVLSWVLRA
jgi:hypothetical protein